MSVPRRAHADSPAYMALAEEIREEIVSGRLVAGEWLGTEPELCAKYAVSRSTLREALKTLMSQGLVTTKRGMYGGTVVSDFGHDDVRSGLNFGVLMLLRTESITIAEAFEARHGLELHAVRLAADRATTAQIEAMRDTLVDDVTTVDHAELTARSVRFHQLLLAASGNRVLQTIGDPLINPEHNRQADVVQSLFEELMGDSTYWSDQFDQHAAVIDAIEAGDARSAAAALDANYDEVSRVTRLLDTEMAKRRQPLPGNS